MLQHNEDPLLPWFNDVAPEFEAAAQWVPKANSVFRKTQVVATQCVGPCKQLPNQQTKNIGDINSDLTELDVSEEHKFWDMSPTPDGFDADGNVKYDYFESDLDEQRDTKVVKLC